MPSKPRFEPSRARFVVDAGGVLLYRTKSGNFFTVSPVYGGAELTKEITEDEAARLTRQHADPATFALFFDRTPPVKISVDIPAGLLSRIDARRDDRLKTRRAVILAALVEFVKNNNGN